MRGFRLAALSLALGSCALTQSVCYSQKADEKKGQSLPIQTNVGSQGYNCGPDSSPLYCYGILVTVDGQPGGSFWLDTYLTGTNAGTGFIVWNNDADLAEATCISLQLSSRNPSYFALGSVSFDREDAGCPLMRHHEGVVF